MLKIVFRIYYGLICIALMQACSVNDTSDSYVYGPYSAQLNINNLKEKGLFPIHYGFERLELFLNDKIIINQDKRFWYWDHMNSNNSMPDTNAVEYYKNLSQSLFNFNDQITKPGLFIKTNKNRIVEFSAYLIFSLPNHKMKSIESVLNYAKQIDLLKEPSVFDEVKKHHYYKKVTASYEETIELILFEDEMIFDKLNYNIKAL